MGFELRGPDPSQCRHMQGIVRVDAADGTPYLFVSRSSKDTSAITCTSGSEQANVYIVRMGSRDKTGERLRSNRLRKALETMYTPPDPADGVVGNMMFDGSSTVWPDYEHPGGMQLAGHISSLSCSKPDANPSRRPGSSSSTSAIPSSRAASTAWIPEATAPASSD